jgi:hypothetical protein
MVMSIAMRPICTEGCSAVEFTGDIASYLEFDHKGQQLPQATMEVWVCVVNCALIGALIVALIVGLIVALMVVLIGALICALIVALIVAGSLLDHCCPFAHHGLLLFSGPI